MAAGNDGSEGMFYGSSPGVARSGTGVGSVNNVKLTGYKTVPSPSGGHGDIVYLTGQPFTFTGSSTLEVYATSKDPEVKDDACNPLPDDTPDLSGKVVVVARGSCTFVTKFNNIEAKGGKYVLVYNTPAPASITYVSANNEDQQVASLTREDGQFLVKQFAAGTKTTLDFSDVESLTEPDTQGGGIMSSFSTYNPTYNLGFKPSVSAPGGNILSTWPLALGECSRHGIRAFPSSSTDVSSILSRSCLIQSLQESTLSSLEPRWLLLSSLDPTVFTVPSMERETTLSL